MKDKQSSNSDIENYDDITEKKNTTKRSISHIIIRWFTTLSGLFVLLLVITLGGAILFRSIEEENDDILLEKVIAYYTFFHIVPQYTVKISTITTK